MSARKSTLNPLAVLVVLVVIVAVDILSIQSLGTRATSTFTTVSRPPGAVPVEAAGTGGVVKIPAGHHLRTIGIAVRRSEARLPGTRVDVLAIGRVGDEQAVEPILVDVLVLAVDSLGVHVTESDNWSVSFALTDQQGELAELAARRDCTLRLIPPSERSPDDIRKAREFLESLAEKPAQ